MRKIAFVLAMLLAGLALLVALRRSPGEVGPTATSPTAPAAVPSPQLEAPASTSPERTRGEAPERAPPVETPIAGDPTDADAAELRVLVISSESRTPVAGVRVRLALSTTTSWDHVEGHRGRPGEIPLTDDEGVATFSAPVGESLLLEVGGQRGRCGAGELAVEPLAAGDIRSVTLAVPTALGDASFFGRVVRAEDGGALPDARVVLVDTEWARVRGQSRAGAKERARVRPDATGLFEVSYPTWDPPSGRVELEGYAPAAFDLVAGFEEPHRPATIRMWRAGSVEVTVLDRGGTALEGVEVHLSVATNRFAEPRHPDRWSWQVLTWDGSTDVQGTCTLDGLVPDQPLEVLLVHDDTEHEIVQALTVAPGELERVEYRLGAGATVRGLLLDQEGEPIGSQVVWLLDWPGPEPIWLGYHVSAFAATETDAQGRFRFEDVPPGDWCIGPKSTRKDSEDAAGPELVAPIAEHVHIATDQSEVELVLRRQRGLYIRGVVLDPDGAALTDNVFVRASLPVGSDLAHVRGQIRSDDAGRFVLGPLPAGQLRVVAEGWGIGEAESEALLVSAGDEGVVLRLRAGARISGRVVDVHGESRAGKLSVTWSRVGQGDGDFFWSSCGAEGFELDGLEAGRYDILAETPDGFVGRASTIHVEAGQAVEQVVVELEQAAVVRVAYASGERALEFRINGQLVQRDWINEGGSVEVSLPPGPVLVRMLEASDGSPVQERTVDAPRGSVVEVTFE